jgi:aerobic-type carbon monoxide dehydrogenase small subunit (CoxS/CutS family)
MFTCKQVSNALSKEDYEKLSPMRKFFLKLHVKLCLFCGKFNSQVMESQDMCRCYKEHEEALATARPKMDAGKKDELRQLLASQSARNDG